MQIWTTGDAGAFAARAGGWLAANPVHGNMIATFAQGLARNRAASSDPSPWLGCALGDGEVVAVAVRVAAAAFVGPGPDGALAALADALAGDGHPVGSVGGERAAAETFARRWTARRGGRADVAIAEGVHVLGSLRPPSGVPGSARPLTADEVPLAARWLDDFAAEALPHRPRTPLDALQDRLRGGLGTGQLLLWHVDGTPVSMALHRGPVHGTGRIGPVWTPPQARRHGYAAAVTAASTRALLEAGATTCLLYTDLSNPTSNGVYARLGYRQVGEAVEYLLHPPPTRDAPTSGIKSTLNTSNEVR